MTSEQQAAIASILERMKALGFPENPRADWTHTTHYEIVGVANDQDEYTWITGDVFDERFSFKTTEGQRVGLVFDMACAFPALLAEVERLRAMLGESVNTLGPTPSSGEMERQRVQLHHRVGIITKELADELGHPHTEDVYEYVRRMRVEQAMRDEAVLPELDSQADDAAKKALGKEEGQ